jgi:ribA/ribD-fused uncharacterized protein
MTTDKFIFFWGGTYSQWCPSTFTIDGVEYNCAEQYMMAKKALMFNDFDAYREIMLEKNPATQKAIGKTVRGFDKEKWEKYCLDIVTDGNYAKFTQNPEMKKELLGSGNREIVEASPEDRIWGIGLHESNPDVLDKSKWRGTNWLGIAIMRVRQRLRDEDFSFMNQELTTR